MIRPDERTRWLADDYQLEEEFLEESTRLRLVVRNTPPVPQEINGRIRVLAARRERAEPLEKSWPFSKGLLLALAVLLLFAIAILFVLSAHRFAAAWHPTVEPTRRELTPLKTIEAPPRTTPKPSGSGKSESSRP